MQFCKSNVRDQLIEVDLRAVTPYFFWRRIGFIQGFSRVIHTVLQLVRHIFVRLVFKKLRDKFCSRIDLLSLLIRFRGKEHLAFDRNEFRRHDHEFAHRSEILSLHLPDVSKILFGDLHNGYIKNVYFIFLDQMEKKIQRTVECCQ